MSSNMGPIQIGIWLGASVATLFIIIVLVAIMPGYTPPVTLARLASPANGVLVIDAVERFGTVPECIARRNEFPKPDRAELECVVGR